jgi:hypothetical protein
MVTDYVQATPAGIQFVGEQDASIFGGFDGKKLIRSLEVVFPDAEFSTVPVGALVI